MEQMASAGPRVELALGRLQLQEQRINALIRRVESVRDQRVSAEHQLEMHQFQLKTMGASAENADPAERKAAEQMEGQMKAEISRLSAEIQRLTAEEADLSAQIASEQARWTAINQQVEELERSLGRR
jgi:chromosome segregation ATPase